MNCTKSNFWYWKQQTIESSNHAFFESFKKVISQIFNANWLKIEEEWFRYEDHENNDASSQRHIECEDHDDNVSSSLQLIASQFKIFNNN